MSDVGTDQSLPGAELPVEQALEPAFKFVVDIDNEIQAIMDRVAVGSDGEHDAHASPCASDEGAPGAHTRWSEGARAYLSQCGARFLTNAQLIVLRTTGRFPTMSPPDKRVFREAVRAQLMETRTLQPSMLDHQEVGPNMMTALEHFMVTVPKLGAAQDMPRVVKGTKFAKQSPVLLAIIRVLLKGHTVGESDWRPFESVGDAFEHSGEFGALVHDLGLKCPSEQYLLHLLQKAALQHLRRRLSVFSMKVFKTRDTREVQRIAKEAIAEVPRQFYPTCGHFLPGLLLVVMPLARASETSGKACRYRNKFTEYLYDDSREPLYWDPAWGYEQLHLDAVTVCPSTPARKGLWLSGVASPRQFDPQHTSTVGALPKAMCYTGVHAKLGLCGPYLPWTGLLLTTQGYTVTHPVVVFSTYSAAREDVRLPYAGARCGQKAGVDEGLYWFDTLPPKQLKDIAACKYFNYEQAPVELTAKQLTSFDPNGFKVLLRSDSATPSHLVPWPATPSTDIACAW